LFSNILLTSRAEGLIDMLTQEKNRLGTAHESVIPLIKEHMNYLNREIAAKLAPYLDVNDCGDRCQQLRDLPLLRLFFNESVILELPDKLWNLLQIGVGGYVIGRSAEKIAESKWGSK
jgi:hypothetical protein